MTSPDNSVNQHDFGVLLTLAHRACDRIKSSVGVRISKASEPFNVGERMGKGSELGWEVEYQANLSNAKTYKKKIQF